MSNEKMFCVVGGKVDPKNNEYYGATFVSPERAKELRGMTIHFGPATWSECSEWCKQNGVHA